MSDTATTEEVQVEEDEEKGGKLKLIVIALVVAVVGFGAYTFLLAPSDAEDPEAAASPEPMAEPTEGDVLEVTTMTVNLKGDASRFARVGFAAVLDAAVLDAGPVEERFPLLKDAAITVISDFTPEQLVTHAGQEKLREDLTTAALGVYPDGEILRIVLTELIVQ